jgi:hypothetical protein
MLYLCVRRPYRSCLFRASSILRIASPNLFIPSPIPIISFPAARTAAANLSDSRSVGGSNLYMRARLAGLDGPASGVLRLGLRGRLPRPRDLARAASTAPDFAPLVHVRAPVAGTLGGPAAKLLRILASPARGRPEDQNSLCYLSASGERQAGWGTYLAVSRHSGPLPLFLAVFDLGPRPRVVAWRIRLVTLVARLRPCYVLY